MNAINFYSNGVIICTQKWILITYRGKGKCMYVAGWQGN